MPLARYFFFVGGALLALLFVSDAFLPKTPAEDRTEAGMPAIRIHSDRKWPERVVFDTSIPTIVPPATAQAVPAPVPTTAADVSAKARAREALAQLPSSDASQSASSNPTKPEPKLQRKRKIAKSHVAPPRILVAQQPRFGFFDFGTW
jgi:hypothetical protein